MDSDHPVISGAAYSLTHVPDLIRYGSKPRREIARDPAIERRIMAATRGYEAAAAYAPDQVFVGNLDPRGLAELPRPWGAIPAEGGGDRTGEGRFGDIVDQDSFYGVLQAADVLQPPLFEVTVAGAALLGERLGEHLVLPAGKRARTMEPSADEQVRELIEAGAALPIRSGDTLVGCFHRDRRAEGRDDENLAAHHLLENLSSKASGALALARLLRDAATGPGEVDFIISCGEEAVGDRYQRGGGGMAKAIGELCGCERASGMDIKNFCAAPASALVTAAAMVKAGLFRNVVVVAGGSLAKLGMKFEAFLDRGTPLLEDCLAGMAFLVTADDGTSPTIRLERGAVGLAAIGASTSDEAVYRELLLKPLRTLGLRVTDIDRYAPELHNPEIMEFAGSGDVARKNYRTIAAMAVTEGEIAREEMDGFIARVGMPGFAPTQGHIPSAVAYLGHALDAIERGEARRVMFIAKASLFLGRCTNLFDGVSFIVERNPRAGADAG